MPINARKIQTFTPGSVIHHAGITVVLELQQVVGWVHQEEGGVLLHPLSAPLDAASYAADELDAQLSQIRGHRSGGKRSAHRTERD
jgi:hypothetical protein